MKKNLLDRISVWLFWVLAVLAGCKPHRVLPLPAQGRADFSKVVALGDGRPRVLIYEALFDLLLNPL